MRFKEQRLIYRHIENHEPKAPAPAVTNPENKEETNTRDRRETTDQWRNKRRDRIQRDRSELANTKRPTLSASALQAYRRGNLKEFWQATKNESLSPRTLKTLVTTYFGRGEAGKLQNPRLKAAVEIKLLLKLAHTLDRKTIEQENNHFLNKTAPDQINAKIDLPAFAALSGIAVMGGENGIKSRQLLRKSFLEESANGFLRFNRRKLQGPIYAAASWQHFFDRPSVQIKRGRRVITIFKGADGQYHERYKRAGQWRLKTNRFPLYRGDQVKAPEAKTDTEKNAQEKKGTPNPHEEKIQNCQKRITRLNDHLRKRLAKGRLDSEDQAAFDRIRLKIHTEANFAKAELNLSKGQTGAAMRYLDYVIRDGEKTEQKELRQKAIALKRKFIFSILDKADSILTKRQSGLGKWYENWFAKYAQLGQAFLKRENTIVKHLKLMFQQDPQAHNLGETIKSLAEHYRRYARWNNNGNAYANRLEDGESLVQSILSLERAESKHEKSYNTLKLANSLGLQAGTTILAPEKAREVYFSLLSGPISKATALFKRLHPDQVRALKREVAKSARKAIEKQVAARLNSLVRQNRLTEKVKKQVAPRMIQTFITVLAENRIQEKAINQYLLTNNPYRSEKIKEVMNGTDQYQRQALDQLKKMNQRAFLGTMAEFLVNTGVDYLVGAGAVRLLQNTRSSGRFISTLRGAVNSPGYKGFLSQELLSQVASTVANNTVLRGMNNK